MTKSTEETITTKSNKKAKLAFRGIEISYEMHVWIQKAQTIRKTAQEIAIGIYEQGKKDHMTNENMLKIIFGVFPDYTRRHLRRITPPELKNVNMARPQPRKESPEIADIGKRNMSANGDVAEPEKKPDGSYEYNTDLVYITTPNFGKFDDFIKQFESVFFRLVPYGDPKIEGGVQIMIRLPVTVKIEPDNQTPTVSINKDTLNKLMRQKKKEKKLDGKTSEK